ncbi:HAD-IIIA family hydrolase [Methylovorus mays]|uniref:HAD-IIIA family hydrolase n=1 Tax=Methylovorus mays TaxID=184077 RepID=UPI001E32B732|nr:HAD-IIIA family hydrolase [Methylovorus mays]MCB5206424.1 HAD-IIIA family hydrolase [Methylovorus mays]
MRSNQFDLIIFDWDGTLANSTQLIVDAICKGSVDVGLPLPTHEAASGIIGLGLREALIELFGSVQELQIQQLMARYALYYNSGENEIPLFDGAAEAVAELHGRGIALAVATGKGRAGLNRALKNSGIGHYFHATRCVDECHSKPHPQMIHELMDEVGASPERTLMIGDTSFDLQMASNAGVSSLGVSYGAHPLERLLPHAPLAHFDDFTKLNQWLIMNA